MGNRITGLKKFHPWHQTSLFEQQKMKTVILYDRVTENASPDQRDVLVQAEAIADILSDLGYEPIEVSVSLDFKALIDTLTSIRPGFVFNLVESIEGQGQLSHLAPALLDHLQIPYTGASTDTFFISTNKLLAKKLLGGSGIPTPLSFSLEEIQNNTLEVQGRYIIKSLWEHASFGLEEDSVIFAEHAEELLLAMQHHQEKLGGACFAEAYIEGREFNLSLLASPRGPVVLPPAEIRFENYPADKKRIVGYRAKWDKTSFEYHHTRRCFEFPPGDKPLLQDLEVIAKQCWHLFALRGYARVDFRCDAVNRPWVLEVNANPCLSPDAGFVAAATQAGLSFRNLVERIIANIIPLEISGLEEKL